MTKRNIGNEIITGLEEIKQDRRQPHGPARSLLLVAAGQPAAVREAFKSAASSPKKKAFSKTGSALRIARLPKAA